MASKPVEGISVIAWPELLHQSSESAKESLLARGGLVPDVQVQNPTEAGQSPPFNPGGPENVWLYTDSENGTVVQIPRRGTWHPNRVQPGWVDLVGVEYTKAIDIIHAEDLGLEVNFGPVDRNKDLMFNVRRVWLDLDKNSNVAVVPKLG